MFSNELENQYQQLIDNINDAVCLIGINKTILICNKLFKKLTSDNVGLCSEFCQYACCNDTCPISQVLVSCTTIDKHYVSDHHSYKVVYFPIYDCKNEISGVMVKIHDTTYRNEQDQKIIDERDRYKTLFENAPIAIGEHDFSKAKNYFDDLRSKEILNLKDYFEKHFDEFLSCCKIINSTQNSYMHILKGSSNSAVVRNIYESEVRLNEEYKKEYIDTMLRLAAGQTFYTKMMKTFSVDGKYKYIQFYMVVAKGCEETLSRVFFYHVDVTALMEKEKALNKSKNQLRLLSHRTITAIENSRLVISRELHDQVGQQIVACRMELLLIKEQISDDATRMRCAELIEMLNQLLNIVRNISMDLRPTLLDDYGLVVAIQKYAEDFERRTGISCPVNIENRKILTMQLGDHIRSNAYRIVQEALNNVLQHSASTQVLITIVIKNEKLVIQIKDNGHGFDTKNIDSRKAIGIRGMKERAKLAGGKVYITSKIGNGTSVFIRIPLLLKD